jgi:elongation factor P
MLSYNEITKKKFITLNGEPYEVLDAHIFRKQQRKPVNQTKLRNLITGKVTEQTFQVSDKAEEADLAKKAIEYIYTKNDEVWFKNPENPKERFAVSPEVIGDHIQFLKEGSEVEALYFDDEIIGVKLPIKIVLEVTEAPPNVKGNTAQGGDKVVTLETGATVTAPLFVEAGDKIEVNTETGEYVGRVN